jgi:hypothetical protein
MSATVQLLPSRIASTGVNVGDAISSSLTIAVDAGHDETRRAMSRLDLSAAAVRTLEATGLHDRVMLHSGGLTWRPAGTRGRVDVTVDLQVEPAEEGASYLHVVTRFTVTDERARERLLDSWAVIGPIAETLVRRAAHTVKEAAEADLFHAGRRRQ